MKVDLTLRFAKLRLNINHTQIVNLGSFSVFCLKAISEGLNLDQISQITLLKEELISEQLEFARERGYLTEYNTLTNKGARLIEILNFVEEYSGKFFFYIDLYTEQTTAQAIYLEQEINRFSSNGKNFIEPVLKQRGTLRLVNEKINKEIFHYFLLSQIPEQESLINQEWDQFELYCEPVDFKDITLTFEVSKFMQSLSFEPKSNSVNLQIPILSINFSIKPLKESPDKSYLEKIQMEISPLRQDYNLIDGELISFKPTELERPSPNRIEPFLKQTDILNKDLISSISKKFSSFAEIKPEIKTGFADAYLDKQTLHMMINNTIRGEKNENNSNTGIFKKYLRK